MLEQIVRGPLLIPNDDGSVVFHHDGALACDAMGRLQFAGPFEELQHHLSNEPVRHSDGVMLPPLLDIHTHIPQHPIRGRFTDGVDAGAPEGKLLAGLNRNVFPAEAKCSETEYAGQVVRGFLADTLAHGVVGGATYMTPSAMATEVALTMLPESWSVGLVLMNQNCPTNLRTDEPNVEVDIERLAKKFGRRLIVTDRFAVSVTSPLRRRASALAERFGLRTQTHLNEQVAEKNLIEKRLYPDFASYTDVYLKDGLLNHQCIAAHCIQMTDDEWRILRDTGSSIAHCPTSNLLLESGVMSLDQLLHWNIPYALATDVGASPTVSMFAEMSRFLQMHLNRSTRATAVEALYHSTRAPAEMLGLHQQFGRLEKDFPMSFIEVESSSLSRDASADAVIRKLLPADLEHPMSSVSRVTIAGRTVFQRSGNDA